MLTNHHLNSTLEENDLSTFLIIPIDSIKDQSEYSQLKILEDGSLYIFNPEIQQVQSKPTLPQEIIDTGTHQTCEQIIPELVPEPETSAKDTYVPIAPDLSSELKFKCIKCEKSFKTVKDYKLHLKWHKSRKKFQCGNCPVSYSIENNLKIHNVLIHSAESPTSCPICGISLTFHRAASLKSHLMVHLVDELTSCDEGDVETEKEDVHKQQTLMNAVNKKDQQSPLTCSHCEIEFQSPKHLKHHISDHAKVWKYFRKRKFKKSTKEKRYICDICSKSFIKQSLLERHLRIHSGEKPFKCTICEQSFTQKGTLQTHLSKHTGIKPFACTLCPARFNQKGNLKIHIKKTHTASNEGQKMFKCPHCSCIFKRIASLNGHVTKSHLKYQYTQENLIGNVMKNLKDLQEHSFDSYITLTESTLEGTEKRYVVQLKRIGDVRWYRCTYCPKMCKKPSDLIRHIRGHTKETPFMCKVCRKSFSLKSTLLSHMNTHNAVKNFKCETCNATFGSKRVLNSHMRKHEYEKLSKWQCIVCDTLFDEFEKALQHKMALQHVIQSVTNKVMKQPLYQTAYGDLTFKAPRPKVPNTGNEISVLRPFHCSICDARFAKKVNLQRHMKYHDGDRRFKCHLCPKAFITSYRLREHVNLHNNIKKYACKICNKRFGTSTNLRRHMITHNNMKPYMCPYCNKHFQTLDLSRRHIRTVHKKEIASKVDSEIKVLTESNNNVVSHPTSVITNTSNKPTKNITNLVLSAENELVQNNNHELSESSQTLNTEDLQETQGFQTFYVNLEDLQLNNSGINLSSFVDNVGTVESFQITAREVLDRDQSQPNPVLMYTNPAESSSSIDLSSSRTPNTIFNNNIVVETSIDSNETRNIFDGASILCTKCNEMFLDFFNFQKHTCVINFNSTNEQCTDLTLEGPSDIVTEDVATEREIETSETSDKNVQAMACSVCNRSFKNKNLYKKHMNIHSSREGTKYAPILPEKPPQLESLATFKSLEGTNFCHCMFCLKQFKKPSDLKRHVRTHTGEKPFSCEICDKNFSLKSTLQSHIKTHDPNNKQFGCDICNTFYCSKSSLKVHMTIHTGQMPYSCEVCKQEFRTISSKKAHEAVGHRPGSKKIKKKSAKSNFNDILKTLSSDIIPDTSQGAETIVQNNEVPKYLPLETLSLVMGDNNLISQGQPLDLESQIVNLDIPPETILSTIPEDQLPVDPTNLLQQLEMSDMVLTTNETEVVPSLILDDVSFLELDAAPNNLQIISLPEADGGVTISIKENAENPSQAQPKPNKEKPKAVDCDICHKTYASKDGLRRHKKNVHGEKKTFGCRKCGEQFDNKDKLKSHEKEHLNEHVCTICSLDLDGKLSLEEHINRLHPQNDMSKEQTSALLNLKLELPVATIDEPLFNNLFLLKKL